MRLSAAGLNDGEGREVLQKGGPEGRGASRMGKKFASCPMCQYSFQLPPLKYYILNRCEMFSFPFVLLLWLFT